MPIKLIVTDMDGTLLDADHVTVPPENVQALRAARARGVKLAIASGRTWSLIRDAAEQLGGIDYAILGNGGAVWDLSRQEPIYEAGFPNGQAVALLRCLEKTGLAFEMYCHGQNYVAEGMKDQIQEGLLTAQFAKLYRENTKLSGDLAATLAGRSMEKINLFYVPPELRDQVQAAAAATGPVKVTNALEGNMEFNYGPASKGAALQALAEYLGLGPEEVMAFGDANNDLEMLQWADWSFAMENGADQAKAAARHIAPANIHAGVGQMVKRFVLEEE